MNSQAERTLSGIVPGLWHRSSAKSRMLVCPPNPGNSRRSLCGLRVSVAAPARPQWTLRLRGCPEKRRSLRGLRVSVAAMLRNVPGALCGSVAAQARPSMDSVPPWLPREKKIAPWAPCLCGRHVEKCSRCALWLCGCPSRPSVDSAPPWLPRKEDRSVGSVALWLPGLRTFSVRSVALWLNWLRASVADDRRR